MRALLVAAMAVAAALAGGCTIERVVLYETVNYPAPLPERTPGFSLNFPRP